MPLLRFHSCLPSLCFLQGNCHVHSDDTVSFWFAEGSPSPCFLSRELSWTIPSFLFIYLFVYLASFQVLLTEGTDTNAGFPLSPSLRFV